MNNINKKPRNNIIIMLVISIMVLLSVTLTAGYFAARAKNKTPRTNNFNNYINVAYSTDSGYIYPTIVSMTSLMKNLNYETFCKFTILVSNNVTDRQIRKLNTVENKYENCSINIVNMGEKYSNSEVSCWSKAMYYRLCLPEILKYEKKCIYVDGDTIIRKDLTDMFNNIDMNNYYIAGIRDMNTVINQHSKHHETLGIPDLNSYVCSGVLIMNLEKLRNDNMTQKFNEIIEKNDNSKNKFLHFPDQDTLNMACYGNILVLPFKYGALVHTSLKNSYETSEYAQWASNKHDWDEGRTDPVIVHYTGEKPWNNIKRDFGPEWWKYADETNYRLTIDRLYPGRNLFK